MANEFTNPGTHPAGYKVLAVDWNVLAANFKFFDETRYLELDIAESQAPTTIDCAPIELANTAGTPNVSYFQRSFDAGTIEGCQWSKPIPPEYKDTPQIIFLGYMATATGGTIVMDCSVSAEGIGDIGTAPAYDTKNSATIIVPGTAASVFAGTITLTNDDSLAAYDHATFHLQRFGTATPDNAGGDLYIKKAIFTYGI